MYRRFILLNFISQCQQEIYLPKNIAGDTQVGFTVADSLDPALSTHRVCFCAYHSIPCLVTTNDFTQVRHVFTEYCLKPTWGSIILMPLTSAYFIKHDAMDFVIDNRYK